MESVYKPHVLLTFKNMVRFLTVVYVVRVICLSGGPCAWDYLTLNINFKLLHFLFFEDKYFEISKNNFYQTLNFFYRMQLFCLDLNKTKEDL